MTPSKSQKLLSATETIALTLRVALEHHDRGQLREAAALYQEVLGMDAAHPDALFLLGLVQLKLGNLHVAIQLLRAAVHARPEATHMHRTLAETLSRAGRHAAALHCYWRILALEPLNPIAYALVGDTLVTIKPDGGNDHAAGSCYQRALLLNPDCAEAHVGMGGIHVRAGDAGHAEQAYRAAIAANGKVGSYHTALADLFMTEKQFPAAADAYRRAIILQPTAHAMLDKLGEALAAMGQTQRAETCHERAAELRAAAARVSRRTSSAFAGIVQPAHQEPPWPDDSIPLAVTLRRMQADSPSRGMPVQ